MNLIEKNTNLNYSSNTLRTKILPAIFKHLNFKFQNFKLEKINKRSLEKDEYVKVCGGCGLKKPLCDFQENSNGTHLLRCKKCTYTFIEILKFRKKLKLLFELRHGKFNGKCWDPDCNTNFLKLPTFNFHHPHKKNYTWKKLSKRSYSVIKDQLEEDGIIPLCNNCHEPYQQTILKDYKKLILNPYLFIKRSGKRRTGERINEMIDKAILNNPELDKKLQQDSQYKGHVKFMIKSWLRKRIILEQLYDGKCINCNEGFLGSLTFHHLDRSKKKEISSKALSHFNFEELVKMLINEECVCLCANCHSMVESTIFRENYKEILNEMGSLEKNFKDIKTFYKKLDENLEKEYERINHLKNSNNFAIINYLKPSFTFV